MAAVKKILAAARAHGEALRYLVFGVLTTLLNMVLYGLFQALFGYAAANSWGNVLDNILCILFAYGTNRRFVFASRTRGRDAAVEFGRFVACRLGTMVLDAVIMIVGGNWLAARARGWCWLCWAAGWTLPEPSPSGAWGSRRFPMCWSSC